MKDEDTTLMTRIPARLLEEFSGFVSEKMGLFFPPERREDLLRGARAAATAFNHPSVEKFMSWALSAPLTHDQVDLIAGHLTIGETYFFRDAPTFDALAGDILPGLIAAHRETDRQLRIWSAGCCTGEEAYSLAILVSGLIPDIEKWHVTILATDINRKFIEQGQAGVYGPWSFRDVPEAIRSSYFLQPTKGRYEIARNIRRMVTFLPLNLAADVYPSFFNGTNAMDLILCRNVLMYFSREQLARVINRLHHCLVEGGWLVVGPTEAADDVFGNFEAVQLRDTTVFRRGPAPLLTSAETQKIVLRANPHAGDSATATAPLDLANALYDEGRYADAAEILAKQPSQDGPAMTLMARALANAGRLPEALAVCDRLVAAKHTDPTGHFLRANVLHERGDLDEAARAYVRALFLDPEFALAHFALGHVCNERGARSDAMRHFRNALRALKRRRAEDILPESEGVTAGRLAEIISALVRDEEAVHAN